MTQENEFKAGWPVVLAAWAGIATGVAGIAPYALGPSMPYFQAAFGWNRTQISMAFIFFAISLFVASPIAGRLADRYGVRKTTLISTMLFVPALAVFSRLADSIWTLYAAYALLGLVGAGTGPLTHMRAVASMFARQRGLAIGIGLTGTGVAAVFTPLVLQYVSEQFGWRASWLALALLPLIAIPVLAFGLRALRATHPSLNVETQAARPVGHDILGITAREAFRDRRFWTMGASIFIMALFITGLIVHIVPMLRDLGVDDSAAAGTASLIGIAVITGRLAVGWSLDKFHGPHVAAVVLLLAASGCLTLAVIGSAAAVVATVFLGFAIGAEVDLLSFMTARYFGVRNYGEIYGWQYGMFVAGGSLSPVVIAALQAAFGGYGAPLKIAAGAFLLSALIFLTLGKYDERYTPDARSIA